MGSGCGTGSCSTGGFGAVKTLIGVVVLAGGAWLGYNFATTGCILGSCDKTADTSAAIVETAGAAAAGEKNECSDKDKADCALGCADEAKPAAGASACSEKKDDACALACGDEAKPAAGEKDGVAMCCMGDKPITECVPSECDGEGKACCVAAFAAAGLEMPKSGSIASNTAQAAQETCPNSFKHEGKDLCKFTGKECDPAACDHEGAEEACASKCATKGEAAKSGG